MFLRQDSCCPHLPRRSHATHTLFDVADTNQQAEIDRMPRAAFRNGRVSEYRYGLEGFHDLRK